MYAVLLFCCYHVINSYYNYVYTYTILAFEKLCSATMILRLLFSSFNILLFSISLWLVLDQKQTFATFHFFCFFVVFNRARDRNKVKMWRDCETRWLYDCATKNGFYVNESSSQWDFFSSFGYFFSLFVYLAFFALRIAHCVLARWHVIPLYKQRCLLDSFRNSLSMRYSELIRIIK